MEKRGDWLSTVYSYVYFESCTVCKYKPVQKSLHLNDAQASDISPCRPCLLPGVSSYPLIPTIDQNPRPLLVPGAWGNIQSPTRKTAGLLKTSSDSWYEENVELAWGGRVESNGSHRQDARRKKPPWDASSPAGDPGRAFETQMFIIFISTSDKL